MKPVIEIILDGEQGKEFVPSYTSLDPIRGKVSIVAKYVTIFDEIYVTFEGTTKTFVEKVAIATPANARTEAFQVFLRLIQPIDAEALPESRVLEAGHTYTIPFTFVVPEKLLPHSCAHSSVNERVQDLHLNLPPSLGDPMAASLGNKLLDDMAPEMVVVSYAVKARIFHGRGSTGKLVLTAESSKRLRIAPAVAEQPPITVHAGLKDDYRLRKEKEIKRGMFKGKLGCLTMESSQPKSLRLPSLRSKSTCPVTTMATIKVRFDPAEESAQPPKLSCLTTKLKAATFFASVPMSNLPGKITDFHYSSTKGVLVETVQLSSRCIASAQWERHSSTTPLRRDSVYSTFSNPPVLPEPSSSYARRTFYTAIILVPITLPKGSKVFVPSFHSCLVSRVYCLDMYLSINSPSATVTARSMHVKVPIQISMEANPDAEPSISAQEAHAIAAREAIALFLQMRSGNQGMPPSPEYEELVREGSLSMTEGFPSPDYVEYDAGSVSSTIAPQTESAPPPGYSTFLLRDGRTRMDTTMMGPPSIIRY